MILGIVVAILFAVLVVMIAGDFRKFVKGKQQSDGKAFKTHAGGTLIIESNKTYYIMPNGVKRTIADYPMDLSPNSKDMRLFTGIMDRAYREHELEKVKNMQKVASEVTA